MPNDMPARKRTLLTGATETPAEALAPRQAVRDPDQLSDDVEAVLAGLGEGASTVAIYREDDNRPGQFPFLVRIPAAEFSNDYVATQYGGGHYKIIITDAQQGPLNPVFFDVDRRLVGKAFAITGAPTAQPNSGDAFKDRLLEILLARALTPAAPAPAPVSHTGETLQIIAALAPLLQRDSGGGFNMEGMAAMMTAVAEIASKMQPAEGLAGVASNLLPIVGKLVDTQTALAAARPRQIPQRVLPAPVPNVPVVQPAPAADVPTTKPEAPVVGAIVPDWLKPFQTFAGVLVSLADTDANPEVYGDVCVDQLGDNEQAFRSAVEAMNAGTLLEDVLNAVPKLRETEERREFAAKLVARVEEGLREVIAQETEEPANG